MKLGTAMDPNEVRRSNRAYRFHPQVGLIPLDEPPEPGPDDEEEGEPTGTPVNPDEPDPDDPDAAA